MKAVDQELDIVVTRQVCVPPQLAGPHVPHVTIVRPNCDVQCRGVSQHLDDGALARGSTYRWLALTEIGDRVRAGPGRAAQMTIQEDRGGRGDDVQARRLLWGFRLAAALCRDADRHQHCQREKGPHQGASAVAVRSSNRVCESAFVHTPTLPGAVNRESWTSISFLPLK